MQKSAPSTLLSVLIGLCVLGTGGAALADDVDGAGTVILPAPLSPTVLTATGPSEMPLSLLEAIRMGIENNLQIEIQRHAPLIAYQEHEAAWGSYDPELFFDFTYANIEDPTANALATTSGESVSLNEFESYTGEGGFRGLIPWLGASYEMALTGDRALSNLSFQSLSPEFNSELLFSVTVPLLRGLIWNQPWTKLKTTQIQQRSSKDEFRRDVMDVVRRTENGYWALIADDERVRVAQKSLETRTALLDQVEIQYQVGVVSKVEIAEAAAGVASGEFDLILAQNRYQTSNDNLIDLVLGSRLRAESRIQLVPTDRPDDYVNYDIDPEQAAAIAFRYRPELDIADRNIERLEINLKFNKNQRLPQLDAFGSYGNRGLAGRQRSGFDPCRLAPPPPAPPCSPPPPLDLGNFDDAFDDFFTGDAARQYTAGAIFSIPIGNISGRHNVSTAELQLHRAHTLKRRVEQDVILDIRKAARDIKSTQEGIRAAQREEQAAAEQLRAERFKLEYGESTPFDVLLREEVLVEAEQKLIAAFQSYRNSVTFLDWSQGTILRNRNISIEAAGRLR